MRVAQINSVCGILSTGRIASDIAKECASFGIENKVFYGYLNDPEKTGIKFNTDFFVHFDALLTHLFGHRGSYSKRATKKLIKQLKAYNPDVIHLHNIHGQYLNVPMLVNYIKSENKKVVWTLHDCWAFTGDCFYFDKFGCTNWQNGCPENCPHLKSQLTNSSAENWRQKKELFSGIENLTLVTPSEWLKNLAEKSFFKNSNFKVIYNGINISDFKPAAQNFRDEAGLNGKFVIMGMCFSLNETDRKGGKYLVKLAQSLPDCTVVLLGIQNPPDTLPPNIVCVNKTNSIARLAEIYSAADVFVNPTLEDNFPTVNIEALACGTPVITFNTGGSPEAVDSKTGIVVEKGNFSELLAAVNTVRANTKSYYSNECRARAERLYNREFMCREYVNLYESMGEKND